MVGATTVTLRFLCTIALLCPKNHFFVGGFGLLQSRTFSKDARFRNNDHKFHATTTNEAQSVDDDDDDDDNDDGFSVSRRSSAIVTVHSNSNNRRELLLLVLSTTAMWSSLGAIRKEAARAAVPTFDDYEGTTNGASSTKDKSAVSEAQESLIKELSVSVPTLESKQNVVTFADASVTSITALESLVETADWAAVRSVLRSEGKFQGNVLGMVRKPYFGLKGGEKTMLKVVGSAVKTVEDGRQDLAFRLGQLEDFALENRSIFFNSLDRQQVEELIAETGYKEKLAEGKNLFAEAKASALDFQQIVSKL